MRRWSEQQIVGQMSFFGDVGMENVYTPPKPKRTTTKCKAVAKVESEEPTNVVSFDEVRVFLPENISKEPITTRRSDEDLQKLFQLAIKMVKDAGIVNEPIHPTCAIFKRKANTWGLCSKRNGVNYISISEDLMYVSEHSLMTTLLHEVLHAVKGCHNHGSEWKNNAWRINHMYGYNIKRTTSMEEKGINSEDRHIEYKYAVRCTKCKRLVVRNRLCNLIKYPQTYRCTCGGSFEKEI